MPNTSAQSTLEKEGQKMNVKQVIKTITENGGLLVYELYNKKLGKKTGCIYHNYDDCVTENSFDVDEMLPHEDITDLDYPDFYYGVIISETADNEWGIIATLLQ